MALTPSAVFGALKISVYSKATQTRVIQPADPRLGGSIVTDESGVQTFYQKTTAELASLFASQGYSKETIS